MCVNWLGLFTATTIVSQEPGLCANTSYFAPLTLNGQLDEREEQFFEFEKKCMGLESWTGPFNHTGFLLNAAFSSKTMLRKWSDHPALKLLTVCPNGFWENYFKLAGMGYPYFSQDRTWQSWRMVCRDFLNRLHLKIAMWLTFIA